jgi:signal transduction histidine kinase
VLLSKTQCRIAVALTLAVAITLGLSPALASAQAAKPVLTVGVYENEPLTYLDEDGTWAGLYPDVLDEIARREGWTLEYRGTDLSTGLTMIADGTIDMLLAVADSPDRREYAIFSQETFFANWGVVSVPDGSDIETFMDLDGKTIAVTAGNVYYSDDGGLKETLDTLHVKPIYLEYASYDAAFAAVARGEADACVTNRLFADINARKSGPRVSALVIRPARLAIAFPPGNALTPTLVAAIDDNLAEMLADQDSVYYRAVDTHIFGAEPREFPVWLKWVLGALGGGITLVATTAWYLRRQVRKRTAELSSVTGQLRTLVDAIPDAYIRIDSETRLLEARGSSTVALTFEAEPNIGALLHDVLPDNLKAVFTTLLEEVDACGFAATAYSPYLDDRQWREVRATVTKDGEILLLIRDITEAHRLDQIEEDHRAELKRKVAERTAELTIANQQLEAMIDELRSATETRDRFIANVSHEFRTPLNAILGFSDILSKGMAGDLNEEQHRQIEMIHSSSKRLASLVEDILALETIDAGRVTLNVEEFDAWALVSNVLEELRPLADNRALKLQCDLNDQALSVSSDPRLLTQILVNLLGNAIKFTDEGCITVRAEANDARLAISVADTGIGISDNCLDVIFGEFAQVTHRDRTKPEGTGLGLSISRRLAGLLGGTLTVQSTEGVGSEFVLDIPVRLAGAADRQEVATG